MSISEVKRAISIWREKKRKDRLTGKLSSASVRHAFDLLRKMLTDAVEDEIIPMNPCKQMKPPRGEKRKVRGFDLAGAREMLTKCAESHFFLIILVAVGTGLRRGEQLALRWIDVNLETARLVVNQNRCARQGRFS